MKDDDEKPVKWPILRVYFEGKKKITVYKPGYAEGAERDDVIRCRGNLETDES